MTWSLYLSCLVLESTLYFSNGSQRTFGTPTFELPNQRRATTISHTSYLFAGKAVLKGEVSREFDVI